MGTIIYEIEERIGQSEAQRRGGANAHVPHRRGDLLTDAEVGEDVVEDGVAGDFAAGDFSDGRDRPTKVRGETIH